MTEQLQKFMQLTKVDVAQKRIYGTFTAEMVDKSGEVADYESTKLALQAWSADIEKASGGKSLGNIRKMHGKEVVGKAIEIVYDDVNKAIHGCVEANEQTIQEADRGYLNGFSIGGSYAKKWADPVHKGKTRFTPVIAEISVVDNPCVPDAIFNAIKDASFTVVKADGTEELRKFAPKEELKLDQVWQADDGSTFKTKAEAIAKNTEIMMAKISAPITAALDNIGKDPEVEKPLKKAMHHVAALAGVINDLHHITKGHESDKGEGHPLTGKLKKHVRGLSDTMHAMAGDEASNMNEAHEAYKSSGATEEELESFDKASQSGKELEKFQDAQPDTQSLEKMTAERDVLAKVLEAVPAQIEAKFDALTKRIKELEAQPAPDNVILTTLIKGGEQETQQEKPAYGHIPASISPAERKSIMNR